MTVDVFQEEHHHGKNQHIGTKANNEYQVLVHPLVHPIGNAHLGLPKGRKAP